MSIKSATSSWNMLSEEFNDMNFITVLEVRRGLFRLHWDVYDVMDGPCQENFILCGSRPKHRYVISYYPRQRAATESSRRRERLPYFVRLSLKSYHDRGSESNSTTSCQKSRPQVDDQPAAGTPRQRANESSLDDPLYVWVNREKNDSIAQLTRSSSGTWRLGTFSIWKQTGTLTLWMDFGTSTLGEKRIVHGLAQLFNNQIRCDVQFTLNGNKTIGAHESILTAGSPVFAAMFQSGLREAQTRRVTVQDIEMDVFMQLLTYLYTGNAPELGCEQITQPLYEAADKYGVESLKHECIEVMLTRLNVENTVEMLVWSHHRSIPKLFEACMKVVADNGRELCFMPQWMDLMTNYPELCLSATQRIVSRLPITDSSSSEMNID